MRTSKKVVFFSFISGLFLLSGCMEMNRPFDPALKPAELVQEADPVSLKRFQETGPDGTTAVESAIELSKKYAALSEEMAQLRQEKQEIVTENGQLKQRLLLVEPELVQAKKELKEANDLLIEMRIELNNWKTDVLGFRDEMRAAEKVQLETLVKILTVLGGEVKTDASLEQEMEDVVK